MTGFSKMTQDTIYSERVGRIYDERAMVAAFEAQGDDGRDTLRLCRVRSYVSSADFANKLPGVQLATTVALIHLATINTLIPLAAAVDDVLGDTPNSITDVKLEELLAETYVEDPTVLTAKRLGELFAGHARRVHVINFLHMYHKMLAAKLVTTQAVNGYESLGRLPGVVNNIHSGRQRHAGVADHQ